MTNIVTRGIARIGIKLNGNKLKSAIIPVSDHILTKNIHTTNPMIVPENIFFCRSNVMDVFASPFFNSISKR